MASAEELKVLIAKKDEIEQTIKELTSVLESQNVGMDGALLDAEQFPRSDVDIYSVRHARHEIICLQNDHKEIMKQIEEGLYKVHAEAKAQREANQQTEQQTDPPMATGASTALTEAFVLVDRVELGSPADNAGLEIGDKISKFGSITHTNFKNLQDIGKIVQHSVGKPVSVTVIRDGKEIHLGLVPQTWSGKGFLGCNIIPLKT